MAAHEQEVQESSSCSVHGAAHLSGSSVYTGTQKKQAQMSVREWTCSQGEGGQAKSKGSLLPCPDRVFQQKVWPRLKVCLSSCLKIDITGVPSTSGRQFIPDMVNLTNKTSHHTW